MNTLSFIKLAIIDGLKPLFPKVKLGIPDGKVSYLGKHPDERVPVDYVCKGSCFQCRYSNER